MSVFFLPGDCYSHPLATYFCWKRDHSLCFLRFRGLYTFLLSFFCSRIKSYCKDGWLYVALSFTTLGPILHDIKCLSIQTEGPWLTLATMPNLPLVFVKLGYDGSFMNAWHLRPLSFQASPCWPLLCWCRLGWAFSRRRCTNNMENTPKRPSSITWVFPSTIEVTMTTQLYSGEICISVCSTACPCRGSCFFLQTSTTIATILARAVSVLSRSDELLVWTISDVIGGDCLLTAPVLVPVVGLTVPIMWIYLLINVITQYPSEKQKKYFFQPCLYTLLKLKCSSYLLFI